MSAAGAAWAFLSLAILFEVAGSTSMKLSRGLSDPAPSLAMFGFFGIAFVFNSLALRHLPLSVTYPIWCGIGSVLVALVGYLVFKEPMSLQRVGSMLLIVAGVWGLAMSAQNG